MVLGAILLAVLSAQIWWTSRCIHSDFHARGLLVRRIRWQPLAPLLSLRWSRRHMLYRVWYSDGRGAAFSCRVVATLSQGLAVEDERPEGRPGVAAPTMLPTGFRWFRSACSVVGGIAIGLSYWTKPYDQVSLPDGLLGPGLLLVIASAAALQFQEPRRWRSTFLIMTLAPVGTVIVRIVLDVLRDPTSHNLLPFELAIAGVVGGLAVAIGMGLGWVVRFLVVRSSG